jgi:hypothetical protein
MVSVVIHRQRRVPPVKMYRRIVAAVFLLELWCYRGLEIWPHIRNCLDKAKKFPLIRDEESLAERLSRLDGSTLGV